MTCAHQWGKMNCSAFRPCFIDHIFLTSDFRQVPRRNLFQFFPFLVHCCLCCRNFHGLSIGINLCTKIVMLQWILSPFPATWSSWLFGKDSPIRSLVDSLASEIHASFVFTLLDAPLPQFFIILHGIAGATDVSNFLRAFLMVSLNSLSSGSMK